jgi:prepilin-type N-terminal cleavage/methylation domain-containing protein
MCKHFFSGSARHAFSLVEVLISISIIGVLIALLLPALSRLREHAQGMVCLSNSRQLAQLTSAYAGEFGGRFPLITAPARSFVGDRDRWLYFGLQNSYVYGHQSFTDWAGAPFFDSIYHCVANDTDFDAFERRQIGSDFWLTGAAYTVDAFFDPAVPDAAWADRFPGRLRALHDVRFPAEKVMVYESYVYHGWRPRIPNETFLYSYTPGRGAVVKMDGSGELVPSSRESAYMNSRHYGTYNGVPGWLWSGGRFCGTPRGLSGADFQPGGRLEAVQVGS